MVTDPVIWALTEPEKALTATVAVNIKIAVKNIMGNFIL